MIDDQDAMGGVGGVRRRVVPADADLPGWVPKDYIDKGKLPNRSLDQFLSVF